MMDRYRTISLVFNDVTISVDIMHTRNFDRFSGWRDGGIHEFPLLEHGHAAISSSVIEGT
jgi:hypothetical protein